MRNMVYLDNLVKVFLLRVYFRLHVDSFKFRYLIGLNRKNIPFACGGYFVALGLFREGKRDKHILKDDNKNLLLHHFLGPVKYRSKALQFTNEVAKRV